jgi:hypothetical protein
MEIVRYIFVVTVLLYSILSIQSEEVFTEGNDDFDDVSLDSCKYIINI